MNAETAAVAKLPSEILCNIFFEAVTDNINTTYISASHVCCFWRDVALKNPPSGAHLPLWNPDWVRAMLERSQPAPVTSISVQNLIISKAVALNRSLDLIFPHSDTARANASRIRKFEWARRPTRTEKRITDALISSTAPLLELLFLEAPEAPSPRGNARHYLLPIFPSDFAPRLHTLRLRSYAISWDSSVFQAARITHLSIHDLHHDHRPTLEQLRILFLAIPHVETLSLRKAISYVNDNISIPFDIRTAVHLSHLRSLDVSAGSSPCTQLFNLIHFPSDINLSVNIGLDPNMLPSVLSSFAPRIDPLTADVLLSVENFSDNSGFSSMRLQSPSDGCAAETSARCLKVHVTSMGEAPVDVLLEHIPITQAPTAHLRLREILDHRAENNALTRTFMNVNTATSFSTNAFLPLLARLRELLEANSGLSSELISHWPRMTHLHMQNSGSGNNSFSRHWDNFVDVLGSWVQTRRSQGLPIPALHLIEYRTENLLSESDKGKLERLGVGVVHWDDAPDEELYSQSDSDLEDVESASSDGEDHYSDFGFQDDGRLEDFADEHDIDGSEDEY
ncbi:hypothetical protein PLICRDRAFT_247481 [Plicaturopsis crispa FD-325 SS-3]|nr:hypothetical protein PLICRDRAFT_247481 [Plicaturopsis crispa FD-325 SS-3]